MLCNPCWTVEAASRSNKTYLHSNLTTRLVRTLRLKQASVSQSKHTNASCASCLWSHGNFFTFIADTCSTHAPKNLHVCSHESSYFHFLCLNIPHISRFLHSFMQHVPTPTHPTLWVIWPAETAPGWTDLIVQLCKAALHAETTTAKRELRYHPCTLSGEKVEGAAVGFAGGGGCWFSTQSVPADLFCLKLQLECQDFMQLGALRFWLQKVVKALSSLHFTLVYSSNTNVTLAPRVHVHSVCLVPCALFLLLWNFIQRAKHQSGMHI